MIAMNEGVGEERPDRSAPPEPPGFGGKHGGIVTSRDEREQQQEFVRLLRRKHQHEYGMNNAEKRQHRKHDGRHVENSFARSAHTIIPDGAREMGGANARGKRGTG